MSFEQHYAPVFLSWLIYLKLIFYPVQFSYDYNFNQVFANGFSDALVILSLIIHVTLIILALLLLKRKSVYTYGILFYFITFSIVSNLFFNIGAPLAERFMYIPSLGICMVLLQLCFDGYNYLSTKMDKAVLKKGCYAVAAILVLLSCYRNALRCFDWKNNNTLFISDVKSVPNNAKAHLNAGIAYIDLAQKLEQPQKQIPLDSAKIHLLKGIAIYPKFIDGYLNMGVIYNWENNFDSAEVWWNRARKIKPHNSSLMQYDKVLATHYYQEGLKEATDKKYEECISDFLKAYQYDSLNADICYNMGGVYFTINDFANAKLYWEKTLQLNPANQQAAGGLQAANQKLAGL
jgi:Tfp pilus assembly protein PilF